MLYKYAYIRNCLKKKNTLLSKHFKMFANSYINIPNDYAEINKRLFIMF